MGPGESSQIGERLSAVLGDGALASRGVVHIAATWRALDGSLRVIRIAPGSPASETDHFLLRAARMRTDAILTTGKILRDEPALSHDELDSALLAWRQSDLGKPHLPQTAVLSSGNGIDFLHPVLTRVPPSLLVVPTANADSVAAAAKASAGTVEIVGREHPSLRDALTVLAERGAHSVLVEAGPSTACELYEGSPAVDELWLSIFGEPEIGARFAGAPFAAEARLREVFDRSSEPVARIEASGRWIFQRLWRSA